MMRGAAGPQQPPAHPPDAARGADCRASTSSLSFSMPATARPRLDIGALASPAAARVLTPDALDFVAMLHRRFDLTRRSLLAARAERQRELDAGARPEFLPE